MVIVKVQKTKSGNQLASVMRALVCGMQLPHTEYGAMHQTLAPTPVVNSQKRLFSQQAVYVEICAQTGDFYRKAIGSVPLFLSGKAENGQFIHLPLYGESKPGAVGVRSQHHGVLLFMALRWVLDRGDKACAAGCFVAVQGNGNAVVTPSRLALDDKVNSLTQRADDLVPLPGDADTAHLRDAAHQNNLAAMGSGVAQTDDTAFVYCQAHRKFLAGIHSINKESPEGFWEVALSRAHFIHRQSAMYEESLRRKAWFSARSGGFVAALPCWVASEIISQ